MTWDRDFAYQLLGRVLLVDITSFSSDGCLLDQDQFHGQVVAVDPGFGVVLDLMGWRAGEQFCLPPTTDAIAVAAAGDYRLRTTGEVVSDPDYTAAFCVHQRPPGR